MVNIRQSFDKILRQWGHNILLQRRISTPDDIEPRYANTLEKHTVRHRYPANRSLGSVLEYEQQGQLHAVDMIYYFRHDASPREGDRIYEDDPRFEEGPTLWLVDYSLPLRGRNGVIDYWTVGVTREYRP